MNHLRSAKRIMSADEISPEQQKQFEYDLYMVRNALITESLRLSFEFDASELYVENFDLDINFLAHEMAIGKRQFARKVKMNTGLSPGKYIQEVRLQHARKLLEQKTHYSVSNVCYAVGYKRPKYFSQQFKLRFGRLPSSYYE